MKAFNKVALFLAILTITSLSLLPDAHAQRRSSRSNISLNGDMSLGLGISTVSAGQNDINSLIDTASNTANANTKDMDSALEIYANWAYRFSGTTYALVIRPSYFTQKAEGSGTGGNFNYELTGYTLMPIFRMYPLENSFIRFYMQMGLGYGSLEGQIKAASHDLKFKGDGFGAMGGIGAEFCFTDAHCLTVEGNLRYMPISRNLATGGSCSAANDIPGLSQCGPTGTEVERDGKDLATTMSGVQGLVGYTMYF